MQAAKYFSYIFFAVAVTVIGMFACLVCYHMLVRRRTARLRQRHISDFRVGSSNLMLGGDLGLGSGPRRVALARLLFLACAPQL